MDANQVGFVHELSLGRHQDRCSTTPSRSSRAARCRCSSRAASRRCRRTSSTRSATPRKVGYNSVQAATNGIEFAKSPEFAQGRGRSRPALRVPAVRRHRQRRQLAPPRRQPVRRQAARDREPARRRRRHRAGHHDRQRRQQRAGGPHHPVRARQPEAHQLPVVPAGVVHGPRRGRHRRAPRSAALHAVAPRARREEPGRHRRADRATGSRSRSWRTFTDWADVVHGPRPRMGPAHLRLPPELRHRHGRDGGQGNEGSRAGHRVPERADQLAKDVAQVNDAAPRQVPVGRRHGARADAELRPVPVADALPAQPTC